MLDNTNELRLRRWFQEVWNEGRLETIDELMHPKGVAHDVTGHGVDLCGPEEFKAATKGMRAAFQDINLVVEDAITEGDKVAMRLKVALTHIGPLGDLPPTGNRVETAVMCVVHFRDGKITEGWNFWDVGRVLVAAAAPPDRTALI